MVEAVVGENKNPKRVYPLIGRAIIHLSALDQCHLVTW